MATLPTYQRRIAPTAEVMPLRGGGDGTSAAALAGLGGAVANVAEAFQRRDQTENRNAAALNEILQRKLTENAHAWTASALSNDHVAWSDWMANAQEKAPPGAPNFAGDFLNTFDAQTEEALKAAPDDESKAFYGQRRVALRSTLFEHARTFEAAQGIKWRDQQWDASIGNVEQVAARDPEQAKTMAAELEAMLRESPNQALAQVKVAKLRDAVAKSATQGMIERNPELALRTLDSYFGVETKMPGTASPVTADPSAPRGIRNNNPGNIRDSRASWQGASGSDGEFVTFETPEAGIRAMAKNLLSYGEQRGVNTIQAIVSRWAPPNENDTPAYVAAVARATGIAPDKPLDLKDPAVLSKISGAMIAQENGKNPYTPEQVRAGVEAALGTRALPSAMPAIEQASAEPPALPNGKPASGNWFINSLDPQTAWTMRNRAQADVHRLQTEQRARMADAERAAGEEVKTLVSMMRDGQAPTPATLATAEKLATGTRWAPVLAEAQQEFTVTSAFRTMPDAQRGAMLDQMRTRGNVQAWTPREAQLFDTLTQLDGKIRQTYRDDPLRAGAVQGLYPGLTPVDTTSVQTVVQTLPERMKQAAAVSARTGRPESPFTGEEIAAVSSMLAPLAPREQSQAIEAISRVSGPYGQAIARQLDGKDKALGLAFALGSQATAGSTDSLHTPPRFVSEMVLKGARAEKDGTSTKGEKTPGVKASQWKASITTAIDGVFPAQDMADKVRDASLYVAHAIASEQGGELSKDDLERATRLVVGGAIVDHNGRKTPIPGGMDASDLENRLRAIVPAQLAPQVPDGTVMAGGVPMPLAEFVKTLPGQQLMAYKPGQYAVLVAGRPVLNTSGRPVIVGVR